MSDLILIVILHTSRAASHGHEIIYERHTSELACVEAGIEYRHRDGRNSFVCIPAFAKEE